VLEYAVPPGFKSGARNDLQANRPIEFRFQGRGLDPLFTVHQRSFRGPDPA